VQAVVGQQNKQKIERGIQEHGRMVMNGSGNKIIITAVNPMLKGGVGFYFNIVEL